MRTVFALMAAAVALGGCVSTASWPDRPEADFGCDAPGFCAVRGQLKQPSPEIPGRGVLELDDGRCLVVDLPGGVVEQGARWWDRRVSVRGRAVSAEGQGAVPADRCDSGLLLYAERVSLKADR